MTSEIRACDPVTVVTEGRCHKAVRASQIAHAGHQHDERTITADVVADPALRTIEE
jgi:hypothetical protein